MSAASLASLVISKVMSGEARTSENSPVCRGEGQDTTSPRFTTVWRAKSIPYSIPDTGRSFKNEGSLLRLLRSKSMPLLGKEGTGGCREVPWQSHSPVRCESPSTPSRNTLTRHNSDASESTVASVATPPPTPRTPSPSSSRRQRSQSDAHLWQRHRRQAKAPTDASSVTLPSVKNLRGKFDGTHKSQEDDSQVFAECGHHNEEPTENMPKEADINNKWRRSRHNSLLRPRRRSPERPKPPKPSVTPASVMKQLKKKEISHEDIENNNEIFLESNLVNLGDKYSSEGALNGTPSRSKIVDASHRQTKYKSKNHRRSKSETDAFAVLRHHSQSSPPPSVRKLKMVFERKALDQVSSNPGSPRLTPPKYTSPVKQQHKQQPEQQQQQHKHQTQKEITPELPKSDQLNINHSNHEVESFSGVSNTQLSLTDGTLSRQPFKTPPIIEVQHPLTVITPSVSSLRQRFEEVGSSQSSEKLVQEDATQRPSRSVIRHLKTPFEGSVHRQSRSASPQKQSNGTLSSISSASVKNLLRQFESMTPDGNTQVTHGNSLYIEKLPGNLIKTSPGRLRMTLDDSPKSSHRNTSSVDEAIPKNEMIHNRQLHRTSSSSSDSSIDDECIQRANLALEEKADKKKTEEVANETKKTQRIEQEQSERKISEENMKEIEKTMEEERLRKIMEEEAKIKRKNDHKEKERKIIEERMRAKQKEQEEIERRREEENTKQKIEQEEMERKQEEEEKRHNLEKEKKKREKEMRDIEKREQEEQNRKRMEEEAKEKEKIEHEKKERMRIEEMRIKQIKQQEQDRREEARRKKDEEEKERRRKQEERERKRKEEEELAKERMDNEEREKQKIKEEMEKIKREKDEYMRAEREKVEQVSIAAEKKAKQEPSTIVMTEQQVTSKQNWQKHEVEAPLNKEVEEETQKVKERIEVKMEKRENERESRVKDPKQVTEEGWELLENEETSTEIEISNNIRDKNKKEEEFKKDVREKLYRRSSSEETPKEMTSETNARENGNIDDEDQVKQDSKIHQTIDRFTYLQRQDSVGRNSLLESEEPSSKRVDRLVDQFNKNHETEHEPEWRPAREFMDGASLGLGNELGEGEDRRMSDVAKLVQKFRKMNQRRSSSSSSSASESEHSTSPDRLKKESQPIPTIPKSSVPGAVRTLKEDELRFFEVDGGSSDPFMRSQSLRVKKSEPSSFDKPRFGSLRDGKSRVAVLSASATPAAAALPSNCRRLNKDELRFFTGEVTNIYRSKTTKGRGKSSSTPSVPECEDNSLPDSDTFFRLAGRGDEAGETFNRPDPDDLSDSESCVLRGDDFLSDSEGDLYELDITLRSDDDTDDYLSDPEYLHDLDQPLSVLVHSIQGELLHPLGTDTGGREDSRCYVVFSPGGRFPKNRQQETEKFTFTSRVFSEDQIEPPLIENEALPVIRIEGETPLDAEAKTCSKHKQQIIEKLTMPTEMPALKEKAHQLCTHTQGETIHYPKNEDEGKTIEEIKNAQEPSALTKQNTNTHGDVNTSIAQSKQTKHIYTHDSELEAAHTGTTIDLPKVPRKDSTITQSIQEKGIQMEMNKKNLRPVLTRAVAVEENDSNDEGENIWRQDGKQIKEVEHDEVGTDKEELTDVKMINTLHMQMERDGDKDYDKMKHQSIEEMKEEKETIITTQEVLKTENKKVDDTKTVKPEKKTETEEGTLMNLRMRYDLPKELNENPALESTQRQHKEVTRQWSTPIEEGVDQHAMSVFIDELEKLNTLPRLFNSPPRHEDPNKRMDDDDSSTDDSSDDDERGMNEKDVALIEAQIIRNASIHELSPCLETRDSDVSSSTFIRSSASFKSRASQGDTSEDFANMETNPGTQKNVTITETTDKYNKERQIYYTQYHNLDEENTANQAQDNARSSPPFPKLDEEKEMERSESEITKIERDKNIIPGQKKGKTDKIVMVEEKGICKIEPQEESNEKAEERELKREERENENYHHHHHKEREKEEEEERELISGKEFLKFCIFSIWFALVIYFLRDVLQ